MEDKNSYDTAVPLGKFLTRYPHLKLGGPEENQRILNFLTRVNMQTPGMHLRYAREPNFFSYLSLQSETAYVLILSNDTQNFSEVQGFGVISMCTHVVMGQIKKVLYVSDVRMSAELCKEAKRQWKLFGNDLILSRNQILELQDVALACTAVLDGNRMMGRLLLDRKQPIRYRKVFPYHTFITYARWKPRFLAKSLRLPSEFHFQNGSTDKASEIKDFILDTPTSSEMKLSGQEFERRISAIPEFSWNNFFLVRHSNGKLVGCVYPMTESSVRRMAVSNISFPVKAINFLTKLAGVPLFDRQGEIKLMHAFFMRTKVGDQVKNEIEASETALRLQVFLFNKVIQKNNSLPKSIRCNVVTIKSAQRSDLARYLLGAGFLFGKVPATFYQIVKRSDFKRGELLRRSKRKMPEFEIGLS